MHTERDEKLKLVLYLFTKFFLTLLPIFFVISKNSIPEEI